MLLLWMLAALLVAVSSVEECKESEWQCSDGTCIRRSQRCDNKKDCPYDSSDEENCDPTATCSPRDFTCDNGRCLSASVRCNKEFECADMTDELNCDGICLPGNFLCSDNKCIPESQRCDNHKDCSDDELHCVGCPANEFQCADKTCVPIRMRCNGYPECQDNSDELNCPSAGTPTVRKPASGVKIQRTGSQSRNLTTPRRCREEDGESCRGGGGHDSDATRSRGDTVTCTDTEFQCANNACVPIENRCNGIRECEDQSDEDNCLIRETLSVKDSNDSCSLLPRLSLLLYTSLFLIYVQMYH